MLAVSGGMQGVGARRMLQGQVSRRNLRSDFSQIEYDCMRANYVNGPLSRSPPPPH